LTARSTYESTVATSNTTLVNSNQANALTAQETINMLGAHPTGGTSLAAGVSAANDAKIRTANATYIASKATAPRSNQRSPWQKVR
jgi:hypothetical protein